MSAADHAHDHTHVDPVDQLAYNELAARYGSLYGILTKEQTKVQILQRTNASLVERLREVEALLAEHEVIDEDEMTEVEDVLAEAEESDEEPVPVP